MFLLFISHALFANYFTPFRWSRVALRIATSRRLPQEWLPTFVPSFFLPLHKMTSGTSSLPSIMYYVLPAEGPFQLIANPGRTRCLFHSNGRRDEELYLPRFNLGGESFRANSRFRSTRACKTAGRPAGQLFFFFSQRELESAVRSLAATNV